MEEAAGNINEAIEISFDIENGEIIERDIDADTGEYIDPKKHPETLFLNKSNYKAILKSLETIPGLKSPIQNFRNNTEAESKRYPIWELQNTINEYFYSTSGAFSDFFVHKDCPAGLRVFCLANLLKNKEYSTVEKYYLSGSCKGLSYEEKELILQNVWNHETKAIFQKLFVSRKEFWSDDDKTLIDRYLKDRFYEVLKSNRKVYEDAIKFQRRHSLDEMIRNKMVGGILPRNVYYIKEQKRNSQSL